MARNAGWSGSIDETLGTQNAGLPSSLGLQQRQGSRRGARELVVTGSSSEQPPSLQPS